MQIGEFGLHIYPVGENRGNAELLVQRLSDKKRLTFSVGFPVVADLTESGYRVMCCSVLDGSVADAFYALVDDPVDVDTVQTAIAKAAKQAFRYDGLFRSVRDGAKGVSAKWGAPVDDETAEKCAILFFARFDEKVPLDEQLKAVLREEIEKTT